MMLTNFIYLLDWIFCLWEAKEKKKTHHPNIFKFVLIFILRLVQWIVREENMRDVLKKIQNYCIELGNCGRASAVNIKFMLGDLILEQE